MKFSLAGALICSLALGAAAGEGGESEDSPLRQERFLEQLDKHLDLKDDQKKKIEAVLKKSADRDKKKIAEMKKLKKRMRELGNELKRSGQETRENIREELSLDQKEMFDVMMQEMKRHRGRRGKRGRGEKRMRGVDIDPSEIPSELRERMEGRDPQRFPPEMRHRGGGGRDTLPPEMRERIEKLKEMRRRQGPGSQRDVPPPDQWDDRPSPFGGGPDRNDEDD